MKPQFVESRLPSPFVLVVGANFTPASDVALDDALHMAVRIPGSQLHLVRVVPQGTSSRHAHQLAERLRDYVNELVVSHTHGAPSFTVHLRSGRPAVEIAKLAVEVSADLVVVGRSSSLGRWLSGNLEERLQRRVSCPVLAARERPVPERERLYIEPPCAACVETRRRSNGTTQWCQRHAERHVHGHPYHYRREMPFAHHDSAVIPTGTDVPILEPST